MNNAQFDRIGVFLDEFIKYFGQRLGSLLETQDLAQVDYEIDDFSDLVRIGRAFAGYTDVADITADYQIHDGGGALGLNPNGAFTIIDLWNGDVGLTPAPVDPAVFGLVDASRTQLSTPGTTLQLENFAQRLIALRQGGADVHVHLIISIDKGRIISSLDLPDWLAFSFFVSTARVHATIQRGGLIEIYRLFRINRNSRCMVLLLADIKGIARGKYCRIIGRNLWSQLSIELDGFAGVRDLPSEIHANLEFRNENNKSQNLIGDASPSLFFLEESSLHNQEIKRLFDGLCGLFSVLFVSNRLTNSTGDLVCEFYGYKYAEILLPDPYRLDRLGGLYQLFLWSYENSSRDKLLVCRQIITAQLGSQPRSNFEIILEKAEEILEVAKSNFSLYLQKNVETYFEKRLEFTTLLQKSIREISSNITSLTNEVTNNLYKTFGIAIGLVAAFLIKPDLSLSIILWVSGAISVYLFIILAYVLTSSFIQYREQVRSFQHSSRQYELHLGENEIAKLKGTLFSDSILQFRIYFFVTFLIYALFFVFTCSVFRFIGLL